MTTTRQQLLFDPKPIGLLSHTSFPATRYQGSKLKLLDWIWSELGRYSFESVLDLFGGTASVSYLFKTKGKQIIFNDLMRCNCVAAEALIANSRVVLSEDMIAGLFERKSGKAYDDFIARTFEGVFYTPPENQILDVVAQNITDMAGPLRAMCYHALFQACLAKRPYNLFHRANLYMRLADVERSFGNKVTWERSFPDHMISAAEQANAAIFDSGQQHSTICDAAENVTVPADLVYLDPPYINGQGIGTNYLDYYHFLEGLICYREWPQHIDRSYKHLPFRRSDNPWLTVSGFLKAFAKVVDTYRESVIVLSYRADGLPSPEDLRSILERAGKKVRIAASSKYQYALSKTATKELLIIAE